MTALRLPGRWSRRLVNAWGYIRRGEWSHFAARARTLLADRPAYPYPIDTGPNCRWLIITPPHGDHVARLLADRLLALGYRADISQAMPKRFDHDFYIVLAAQTWRRLPPGERLYLYQLEQTLASHWFTPRYLTRLKHCRGVLEYKLGNIARLAEHGIVFPHLYYLPLGARPGLLPPAAADGPTGEAHRPVVFYGAWRNNARRRALLDEIEQCRIPVERHDNLFPPALYQRLTASPLPPVILNLHHYQPAQLETPRLWEALSLGLDVVSEDSPDLDEDPALAGAITIAPAGNVPALAAALRDRCRQQPERGARQALLECSARRFNHYFDRFLLAEGFLAADDIRLTAMPREECFPPPPPRADAIPVWCLTLPETPGRYANALALPADRRVCGLRRRPGWIGCALSYREMARQALAMDLPAVWIIEDDVTLSDEFTRRRQTIWQWLCERDDWDLCVGHLTLLGEGAQLGAAVRLGGDVPHYLLGADDFLGMACNLYSRRALTVMAEWDPALGDEHSNTIDQYLKARLKRLFVAWPYLVEHACEHDSTLWGFNNAHYQKLIAATRARLDRVTTSQD